MPWQRGAVASELGLEGVIDAHPIGSSAAGGQPGIAGQGGAGATGPDLSVGRGPPSDRGPARHGQNHPQPGPGAGAGPEFSAYPVHLRPAPRGHSRHLGVRQGHRAVRLSSGADLRRAGAGRRDQPGHAAEKALLLGDSRRSLLPRLEPILDHRELALIQAEVPKVRASDALVDYVLRLVEATRSQPQFAWGLSPRASLALLAAARAWAFLSGRDYVIPEDVQAVLPAVVGHRLRERADPAGHGGGSLVQWLLREVPAL